MATKLVFGVVLRGSASSAGFRVTVARACRGPARRHRRLFGTASGAGGPAGTLTFASSADTKRRVAEVRELAAGRIDRSDALLQTVLIGEAPATAAARLAAEYGTVTAEQLLDTPFVVLARDPMHTAELLAERQERFGFDSFMTHEPTWTHSASSSRFIAAESEPREDAHFVGVNT